MFFHLVRTAVQTLFSTTIGHLSQEFGVGDLIEAGIHKLREVVDLGGYEQQAAEAILSAGDGVLGFVSEGNKQLVNVALHGLPAESR